jgi:pSer/pThr/pTyr-binding forkhead associated (FHA) protein
MFVRITEAGPNGTGLDFQREVVRGTLTIGGAPPCDVVVPALGVAQPVAELRVGSRGAELARTGGVRVAVGGRDVDQGRAASLGPEVLVTLGEQELVFSCGRTKPPGQPDSASHPSAAARDLLKEVYAALGVPEEHPGLVVHDRDGRVVKQIELAQGDDEVTIGRQPDNRLVLYHGSVSKHHARVVRDGIGFFVEDLDSKNGTEVNAEPVRGRRRLKSGDRIRIGNFAIRFIDPKQAVEDMADSVPDLRKVEKATRGEQILVGGAGDVAETVDASFDGAQTSDPSGSVAFGADEPEPPKAGWLFWLLIAIGIAVLAGIAALVATNL